MDNLVYLILTVLPIIIVSIFVVIFDREREPFFTYVKCYLFGFFAVCIVLYINSLFGITLDYQNDDIGYMLMYSFIFTACLEEICKFISLLISSKLDKHFDSYFDAVIYSVFIALGFSFLENISFIVNANFALRTIIVRAVFSVPSHVAYGVFMGKYFELSKINPKKKGIYLILSLIIPIIIHGLFDFLSLFIPRLVSSNVSYYTVIGFVEILLFVITVKEVVSSSKRSNEYLPKKK